MERSFAELQLGDSLDEEKLMRETYQHLLKTPFVQDLIRHQKKPLENEVPEEEEDSYDDSGENESDDEEENEDDEENVDELNCMEFDRFVEEVKLDPSDFTDPTTVEAFSDALFFENEKYDMSSSPPSELAGALRDIDCSGDGYPISVSSEAFEQWTGHDKEEYILAPDDWGDDDQELFEDEMMEQEDQKGSLYDILQEVAEYADDKGYRHTEGDDVVTFDQIHANIQKKCPGFDEDRVYEVKNKYLKYDPEYQAFEEEYVKLEDQIDECEEEHEEVASRFQFFKVVVASYADVLEKCQVDLQRYSLRVGQGDANHRASISAADQIRSQYEDFFDDDVTVEEIITEFFSDATGLDEVVKAIFEMTNTMHAGIKALCELFPTETPDYMEVVSYNDIKFEQNRTDLCFDQKKFERLAREVGQDFKTDLGFEPDALLALQTAAEDYLIEIFKAGNLLAVKEKRDLLTTEEIRCAREVARVLRLPLCDQYK